MNRSYCRSPHLSIPSYLSQSPISLLRLLISTFPPFAFRSSHFALWPLSVLSSLCCSGTFLPLWLHRSFSIIFLSKLNIRSTPIELWEVIHPSLSPISSLCQSAIAMPIQMGFMLSPLWWVGAGSLLHFAIVPLLPLPENIGLFQHCPTLLLLLPLFSLTLSFFVFPMVKPGVLRFLGRMDSW